MGGVLGAARQQSLLVSMMPITLAHPVQRFVLVKFTQRTGSDHCSGIEQEINYRCNSYMIPPAFIGSQSGLVNHYGHNSEALAGRKVKVCE